MFRHWKLTVRKTILSASIDPDATWTWLLQIEQPNTTFESLYDPGDYFRTLDTKLCVAVDMLVRDNHSLKSDIDIETETLAKQGKRIAGRQVLQMVYKSYKTNVENGTVYDVMDVIAVELHGNQMEHFLHRWDKVILGLSEPMPENTKKAFFVSKVRNCQAFQREYTDWKRKSDDDPTKTLETLRQAMKDLIEDARREKVREEELRGLSGYVGRRQAPPAYAAGIEDNNKNYTAPAKGETPTPTKGAKERGRSRNRRGQLRSASPGVRSNSSNSSNDNKGKGKGKFDSRKMGCMYFNQGKGSCLKADRCTFSHDPNIPVYVPKGKGKGKRKGSSSSRSASPAGRSDRDSSRGEIPLGGVIPLDVVHRLGEVVEVDRLIPPNTRLNLATTSQRVTAPSETGVLSSIMTDKQEGRIRYYAHLVCLVWQQRRKYYLFKTLLRLYTCMSHT